MASKFYHAVGVNKPIVAGSFSIAFAPYEHVGIWAGVYEANKPAEIEALDASVLNPKSGVIEITADEYNAKLKKKQDASNSYQQSLANSTPTPGQHRTAHSADPIDTTPAPVPGEPIPVPLDSVEDALKVVPREKPGKA